MSMNSSDTGRNDQDTSRMTNSEKIMFALEGVTRRVSTTELSEMTGIGIKNISRYLKELEKQSKIERTTVQDGKKRYVYVENITGRKEGVASRNDQKRDSISIKKKGSKRNNFKNDEGIITSRNEEDITSHRENIFTKKQKTDLRYVVNMAEELRKFGRVMPLDQMQKLTIFLRENKADLITAVDYFLRIWNNPSQKRRMKKGGIVEKRNKRMREILEFLEGLE